MENKTKNNRIFDQCQTDRCEECTDKKRCCAEACTSDSADGI